MLTGATIDIESGCISQARSAQTVLCTVLRACCFRLVCPIRAHLCLTARLSKARAQFAHFGRSCGCGGEPTCPGSVRHQTDVSALQPPPQRLTHSVCKVARTTHCFYCSQYPGVLAGDRILIYVSCTKGLFYFFKYARLWPCHRCYFMCRFLQRLKIARHQNRLCCTQC